MGFPSTTVKSNSPGSLFSGLNLVSHHLSPNMCNRTGNRRLVARCAVNLKNDGNGEDDTALTAIRTSISEKIGKIEEDRLAFPELVSGEVPRVFR